MDTNNEQKSEVERTHRKKDALKYVSNKYHFLNVKHWFAVIWEMNSSEESSVKLLVSI